MTPEVATAITRVAEEVEVQLVVLEREAVRYAQEYAEYVQAGRPGSNAPKKPRGMQGLLAEMIRDLTLDELALLRRGLA